MSNDQTQAYHPTPKRPKHLWSAWEATVGYMHTHHTADATLRITIHPLDHYIGWDARLTWGNDRESVQDKMDFAMALTDLWRLVEHNHQIFETAVSAARRPANYDHDAVLDEPTFKVFSSLVNSTDTVFQGDWQIIITYRPVEKADKRVQTRLTADNHQVNRGANGPTLREACRNLLRNTAPIFHQYRNRPSDSSL